MNLDALRALLAMGMPPPADGKQRNPAGDMVYSMGLLVIFGLMFYVVLIRPQQKKAREHAELMKALRPGDKILTSGGILGVVISVKDKSVSIRSADTKLEILKSAVSEITEKAASSSEA
ncbi:MAG: preprotein translocase subunit YajC [Verrucomicrobia bacterium]|nr:preprotein translocase subunit YajC [Verrucomicrobiota bacterium]